MSEPTGVDRRAGGRPPHHRRGPGRRARRRQRVAALLLAGAIAVTGCDVEGDEVDGTDDVAATDAALETLAADLADPPAITDVTASYDRSTGRAMLGAIRVSVATDATDRASALDTVRTVARETWTSGLPEVETLEVVVRTPDGTRYGTDDVFDDLVVRARDLDAEFGPRP